MFVPLRAELARQITAWSRARIDVVPAALGDDGGLAEAVFYLGLLAAWSQADIQAADSYLTRSLALARRAPKNPAWQRDLSVCLNRIGDVKFAGNDRAGALAAYDAALAIRSELAALAPSDPERRRDKSISGVVEEVVPRSRAEHDG